MFSSNNNLADRLYKTITEYNLNKPSHDQIKFLHGSSSAIFAFIGRKVVILNKSHGEPTEKIIPSALIPTGMLRKLYGVYPISGELEIGAFSYGSRKSGLNYKYLSGSGVTYDGISSISIYANNAKRFSDIKVLHERITSLIKYMDVSYYLRSLKMLVMEMTNLMLLDQNAFTVGNQFLLDLVEKYNTLRSLHPENEQLIKYFDKYKQQLDNIVCGKSLPFKTDEAFQRDIFEQYPVIFCSTAESIDFNDGMPGERIIKGELDFSTIKIILTPFECVNALKDKCEKMGLSGIQIVGYQSNLNYEFNVPADKQYGMDFN